MVIVVIRWYIKPTEEAVAKFKKTWVETLTIGNEEREHLIGEYLSKPMTADELRHEGYDFALHDLGPQGGEPEFYPYMNVGLWDSLKGFHDAVGRYMKDDKPKEDFEQRKRERSILVIQESRRGKAELPSEGSC